MKLSYAFSLFALSSTLIYGEELEQEFLSQSTSSSFDVDLPIVEFVPQTKSPAIAVTLSAILPGLGHTYLGEYGMAGALMGSTGVGIGLSQFSFFEPYLAGDLLALSAVSSYGIYSAYRDARNFNGRENYSYKMPQDSFGDLAWAPFRWAVLKKPEVWGGILGSLVVGSVLSQLAFPNGIEEHIHMAPQNLHPAYAFPVSIGEETLFRGFLQSAISETTSPAVGIALSSVAFGLMHIPNASELAPDEQRRYYTFIVPYLSAAGAYFGWLTYKNQSLQESVAVHAWYDFAIFLSSSIAQSAAIGEPRFDFSFSF
ncbi:MAG: CPBP family intramembrane metalloprotease [Simkaniaceae bacterium]|nr:CPBP family intramembrane metalloprotease [Candidatus Sacchlamyda saccharinae]